jgi:NAD(P)-dependent dehydrogenase (short-subunit alcohol dehydrogenase family)
MGIGTHVAVVTGATSVVGRAVASEFARLGARVIASGSNAEAGAALEHELREEGFDLTFVRGDLANPEDCERVASTAVDEHGSLDVLVCNPEIDWERLPGSTHEPGLEDWRRLLGSALAATFLACRSAIPIMVGQGAGAILTIPPVDVPPVFPVAARGSLRAVIEQFTQGLAREYLASGIRANTIFIGSTGPPPGGEGHPARTGDADDALLRIARSVTRLANSAITMSASGECFLPAAAAS